MADEQKEVIIKVTADTEAAEQGLNAVNQSIDNVEGSADALASKDFGAKKVKQLKAEMDSAATSTNKLGGEVGKAAVKIQTIDKDKAFGGLVGGVQGAVGSLQIFQGALSLAGVDLGGFEKTLQTMAGLASLQSGLSAAYTGFKSVKDGITAYKVASEGGAVASRVLGAAMNTIPLLAIITAVVLLITHWKDLVGWFEKGIQWIKRLTGAYDDQKAAVDQAIASNKALASSTGEIVGAIDWEMQKRRAAGKETADLEAKKLAVLRESLKQQLQNFLVLYNANKAMGVTMSDEQVKAWGTALTEFKKVGHDIELFSITQKKKADDANAKADKEQQARNDKHLADLKAQHQKEEDELKQHLNNIKGYQQEASEYLYTQSLDDNQKAIYEINKKYDAQLEEAKKYNQSTVEIEQARLAEIKKANDDNAAKMLAADEANRKARKDAATKDLQDQISTTALNANTALQNNQNNADLGLLSPADKVKADWEARKEALDETYAEEQQLYAGNTAKLNAISAKYVADSLANDKQRADGSKKIDAATQATKQSHYQQIGQMAQALTAVLGESTVAGKAMGIASATIDTYVGASKALAQGGFWGIAQAAVVIASGLANVKKIISTKVDSTAQGVVPTAATPGATPVAPVINTTVLNREAPEDLNSLGDNNGNPQTSVRAYIVSKDLQKDQQQNNLNTQLSSY